MHKFLGILAVVAIVFAGGSAQAAPGFYVGADVGWAKIDDHSSIPTSSPCWWGGCKSYSQSGDSVIAGVHAGYDWQSGNLVFGVEGDVAWSDASNSINDFCGGSYCDYTQKVDLKELSTLRGRLGYHLAGFVPYITGGLAVGLVRNYVADNNDPGFWDQTKYRTGYVVGGGVEYPWSNRISLRVQGEYYDLGSTTFTSETLMHTGHGAYSVKFDDHGVVATVGASYKFD
jgi:outer membrane immunogenic protein